MDDDDRFLPISGLQHLLFCERQCALIHVERVWVENALTVEGRHLHEKVDEGWSESDHGARIVRSVVLRSTALGLVGRADVVEFSADVGDAALEVRPVEYKHGSRRAWIHDEVQLCAQGMALEEMLGIRVTAGAIYHGRSRRRREVTLDDTLRDRTRAAARRFHEIIDTGATPRAQRAPKCGACSLVARCQPGVGWVPNAGSVFLRRVLEGHFP